MSPPKQSKSGKPSGQTSTPIPADKGFWPALDPTQVLRDAIEAVPAVRYALAVAGVASAVAIATSLVKDYRIAILGTALTLVLMVIMVLFARLTRLASKTLQRPIVVLTWFSLILLIASTSLLATSVFFSWPQNLSRWLTGANPDRAGNGLAIVKAWTTVAKDAKEKRIIAAGRPMPGDLLLARSNFESWWKNAGFAERKSIPPALTFQALSLTARLHRVQEIESEAKPASFFWVDQSIRFFEESQDPRHLAEALLDKAALYLELSQIVHSSIEKFSKTAREGDAVMARTLSLVTADKKSDALRIWSRFYYNLARPTDGDLAKNWNNGYLMLSHTRVKEAYELAPTEMKNSTQLARATQRLAANPPQNSDPAWTSELKIVLAALRKAWRVNEARLKTPTERVPPLNIQGVLAMDVARREFLGNGNQRQAATQAARLIEEQALPPQREAFALIQHTEWEREYGFDISYDLGRIKCVLLHALATVGDQRQSTIFSEILDHLRHAKKVAKATQVQSALNSLSGDPNFLLLTHTQREQLRQTLTIR